MVKESAEPLLNTSRREFLKNAAVAAAGVPLVFSPYVQRRAYSCIIIGAGLSGLAAAHALKDWDVTVLEARPRIGGRVISFNFKENPELVRISPISGPGVCGAEYPLKVAALGESSGSFGFADDLRPPGTIGNQPRQAGSSWSPWI